MLIKAWCWRSRLSNPPNKAKSMPVRQTTAYLSRRRVSTQRGVIASILLSACSPGAGTVNRMPLAPRPVAIPASDTSALQADLFGAGKRGVMIVAHGGRYSSRSNWTPQAQQIAAAGFHVLLLETRAAAELAAGREIPCLYDEVCLARDVLAGVRYLRGLGTTSMAIIGGSIGQRCGAEAARNPGTVRSDNRTQAAHRAGRLGARASNFSHVSWRCCHA